MERHPKVAQTFRTDIPCSCCLLQTTWCV